MNLLTPRILSERNALFHRLPRTTIEKLVALGTKRDYGPNAMIYNRGDVGEHLYVVDAGQVRVIANTADGREVSLNVMGPGDLFGEIALLDSYRRTANARTIARTTLVVIHRDSFLELLESEPRIAIHLVKLFSQRMCVATEIIEDALFLDVPSRLAKRLLELAERHGERTGDAIQLQISQGELAHFLSLSRQAVNRYLQQWRDAGWLDLGRGRIHILDAEALGNLGRANLDG